MADSDVRIGFVGCGGIGNEHLKIWQRTPGAKVVAVCDVVPERAAKAAELYSAEAFTDLTEMLKKADIEAVDICTPSGLHAEQSTEALEAGKHALTEKPIDINLDRIDKLIATADRTGLKLACIFQYRFSPEIQRAHQLIQGGRLGRLISGSTYIKWFRAQSYYSADDWRGTYRLDGGVLGNQGIHSLDQLCWMAGPVAEVDYAYIETIERDIEAETFAIAVCRFESGARGVVEGTTNCFPGFGTRTEIFGTKGSASFDGNTVTSFRIEGEEIDLTTKQDKDGDASSDPLALGLGGHAAQMLDFVQAIRQDRDVLCSGRDARVAVDCLNKIYQKAGAPPLGV
ncbi:MAG: Gfo/Idh/MocA family oxidoreductase [Armatimonadetes bacterium]|nr:Gfo/Idh/MocA family oxidoreductase [Armatimonadota bacterium]